MEKIGQSNYCTIKHCSSPRPHRRCHRRGLRHRRCSNWTCCDPAGRCGNSPPGAMKHLRLRSLPQRGSSISGDQGRCKGRSPYSPAWSGPLQCTPCIQKSKITHFLPCGSRRRSARHDRYERHRKAGRNQGRFWEDSPAYVPISALFQTLQTKRQRHPWWGKACLPLARFWIIFKR